MVRKVIDIVDLIEFDLRSGKYTTIEVGDVIPYDVSEQLQALKRNLGVKVLIQGIEEPEHFVRTYYENKGFFVARMPHAYLDYRYASGKHTNFPKDAEQQLYKLVSANFQVIPDSYCKDVEELLHKPGIPDFVVLKIVDKIVTEFFFVEVKSAKDSLRYEQLFWIFSSNVPVRVVYCREEKKVL